MGIRKIAIIAAVVILFFVAGCGITGKSAAILKDQIEGCGLNTDIDVLKIDDVEQACYKEHSIYFSIENTGSSTISGFSVFLESDYNLTMVVKSTVSPGGTKQEQLFFGSQDLRGVKTLTVYPMIGDPAQRIVCTDSKLTIGMKEC